MQLNFLKKSSDTDGEYDVGKRKHGEKRCLGVIVAVVIAVGILVWGNGEKMGDTRENSIEIINENIGNEEYIRETEKRLENMISTVKGAGEVNVMVVFESKGEKVPAVNKKNQQEKETDTEQSSEKALAEENVIMCGSGAEEQPYVLKEKIPVPAGVFVTATGAVNESVKLEIYEAIKALYGISGHRIKVSSAKAG